VFQAFVESQTNNEPFTEELFKRYFKTTTGRMEVWLATYTRTWSVFKSHELRGQLPKPPAALVREATQSEVARLQADAYIADDRPAFALNALRIAYWRGEREPAMLAALASIEEKLGSVERAQKITKPLMALPTPPRRVLLVEAKLLYRATIAGKPLGEKLTVAETETILAPLGRATHTGPISEELCTFFAEVVMHCDGHPQEGIGVFLEQAAKHYPNNAAIRNAASFVAQKS
jgi:hypothetical protein